MNDTIIERVDTIRDLRVLLNAIFAWVIKGLFHTLHMNTLEDRRLISQILFILSLLHAKISTPMLLNELKFKIPQRFTRNYILLDVDLNLNNSPFSPIKRNFNEIFSIRGNDGKFIFDFNLSLNSVKARMKQYFEKM